ncbi:MAG TPA: fatty acid--CoA ligase [Pseudonocardiaceae bacterium]|jgi:fatty-acyl-CoA synthase|nr:fatty acid--CoA ligase [Pseudonocardiaceae bacterium]
MLSTMQEAPLSLARLLRYGTTVHGASEVVTWTGESARRISYAELGKQAARLANALRSLGIDGDQRVGTFMWNNAEHLAAYLAVPAMGAVLHTLNIRLATDQLTFITNHAEDQVVLVDASLIGLLNPVLPTFTTVKHVIVVGGDPADVQAPDGVAVHDYATLLAGQQDTFDWPTVDENSAAAMCYTSGTTGDPKGVAYSHRSIWLHSMQVCMSDGMNVRQSDRAVVIVPMFHAMSWGMPYAAMMVGATLIMPDRFLQPEPMCALFQAEKPTMAAAVPTIWQGVLQHLDAHPQDLSYLKSVVVGGSACPPALMRAFEQKYGVHITHAWGMTETSPLASLAHPPAGVTGEKEWEYRTSQGRLVSGVEGRLVDDNDQEVPWDNESVGEIEVRGPWVTGRYYRVDDPEKFHDGWLRTGDVGAMTPDGFIRLTDRAKDVIKSGGEWISSVELENAVMGHPAVLEAAVIGVPDPKWDERPLVAVVLRDGQKATAAELREFLGDKVPHWQVPESWTFIAEVPKTSVGKYDKKRLRGQHSDGGLDVQRVS